MNQFKKTKKYLCKQQRVWTVHEFLDFFPDSCVVVFCETKIVERNSCDTGHHITSLSMLTKINQYDAKIGMKPDWYGSRVNKAVIVIDDAFVQRKLYN